LTEWFPPAVGGSGELLANVYSRISTGGVDVITAEPPPGAAPSVDTAQFRIMRADFRSAAGILALDAVRRQIGLIRVARRLATASTVVHCGRAIPEGSAAWLWSRMGGPSYICWTHGEELTYAAGSRELSWLLRRVHRGAAALIANSRNTARLLLELGNSPDKIHVVYPGVDTHRFAPNAGGRTLRSRLVREGELMLLTVGRLQRRKGHDLVIQALAQLQHSGLALRYVIVGDGPEAERLKRLAVEAGVADRVSFAGEVRGDQLPAYYAASDIFVHPNRIDGFEFEGFGLVFLEAAATGVPVIGGRSGGVPEAIDDGITGLLVSGEDALELEQAIRRLAASSALRAQFGQTARARVLSKFTWQRAARQVEEIDNHSRRAI
jgi:phosphatidylinositol alpha-1,6-mannosyltransferase